MVCCVYLLESPHKIRKNPQLFVFLSYQKNFVGTQKRVRISYGKRAIGLRVIEVRQYMHWTVIGLTGFFSGR